MIIPGFMREQLHHCPRCGQEGFTAVGLRFHRCPADPRNAQPRVEIRIMKIERKVESGMRNVEGGREA